MQKGIEMNSCGCLLDPCWFGRSKMGVFFNGFTNLFFCNLPTLRTFFCFAVLLRFGNGCCTEHVQGFEGFV